MTDKFCGSFNKFSGSSNTEGNEISQNSQSRSHPNPQPPHFAYASQFPQTIYKNSNFVPNAPFFMLSPDYIML